MNNFLLLIAELVEESWFWQGIIINTSFALGTMPFTNKIVQKVFRNRKGNRIKNARAELRTYCLQHLIKDKHIDKVDFENEIYMLTIRYKLDKKDIYNDQNTFLKNLTQSILQIDLLDNSTKEKISNKIRKEKIFTESDDKNLRHHSTVSNEREGTDKYNEENIELDKNEKREVFKYTGVITSIIFIILLMYTFLSQVLIKAYGIYSIVFINTIIIILAIIPILVNAIIHFKKFDEYNKIILSLFILISILNIINFISIARILLYWK